MEKIIKIRAEKNTKINETKNDSMKNEQPFNHSNKKREDLSLTKIRDEKGILELNRNLRGNLKICES